MAFAPKHILVPVAIEAGDDLSLAEHAVFAACDMAIKFSSKISLLHLVPPLQPGSGASIDVSGQVYKAFVEVLKARLDESQRKIQVLERSAEARGVAVEARVIEGLDSISKVILDAASDMKADLLVVGSHGRHGLSLALFGSVAEKIARHATIPVLLLHPESEKASKK